MTEKPATPRETYAAYLKGEIDLDEIDRRAQAWVASQQANRPTPKKD